MSGPCQKCGVQLESPWSFCPKCGAQVIHKAHAHMAPEPAPVKQAFGGLLLGVLFAPVLILTGAFLCLTISGVFIGIPMILVGIMAPLAGPVLGINEVKGKCPWCGVTLSAIVRGKGFNCHACSHRIAIEERRFVRGAESSAAEGLAVQ